MGEYMDEVTESFHRCRRDERFLDTFYDLFLATSSEIADMFSDTDFRMQKTMLRESLLMVLCFNLGMPDTRDEVRRLGQRHRDMGITAEHYGLWLDSLCEAVKRHDDQYTPELDRRWRQAMQPAIDEMLSEDSTPS